MKEKKWIADFRWVFDAIDHRRRADFSLLFERSRATYNYVFARFSVLVRPNMYVSSPIFPHRIEMIQFSAILDSVATDTAHDV